MQSAITVSNLVKKFRGFTLDIPTLSIPKGFTTLLIGENGAGKTTLLNILAGIREDYEGELQYFEQYSDKERDKENCPVRDMIGYGAGGNYYLPTWTMKKIADASELLFNGFHKETFEELCTKLGFDEEDNKEKQFKRFSDGMKMRLVLAGVLARDTKMLILDEPTGPLDVVMRERFCEMMQDYLAKEEGERSILISTHDVMDIEDIADYVIVMEKGQVLESGFVDDIKDQYVCVKGDAHDIERAKEVLYSIRVTRYGFEGICLAENLDRLAGMDVLVEKASLSQISRAIITNCSEERSL